MKNIKTLILVFVAGVIQLHGMDPKTEVKQAQMINLAQTLSFYGNNYARIQARKKAVLIKSPKLLQAPEYTQEHINKMANFGKELQSLIQNMNSLKEKGQSIQSVYKQIKNTLNDMADELSEVGKQDAAYVSGDLEYIGPKKLTSTEEELLNTLITVDID